MKQTKSKFFKENTMNYYETTQVKTIEFKNIDPTFFSRNNIDVESFEGMLQTLPVCGDVVKLVVDGGTTGYQSGTSLNTSHPMIYGLDDQCRKVRVFKSSKGRASMNIGAKRILTALQKKDVFSVLMTD